MAVDVEGHRRVFSAVTNLRWLVERRGVVYDDPGTMAKLAPQIREEWEKLQEAMPGVLAELPELPGDAA